MAFSFENLKANLSSAAKKTGAIAEKAVKKGSEIAETAVKKGSEVAEIAKLNISLKEKESDLKKLFFELGKLTYDKATAEEIAAKTVDIDDKKAEIAALKVEIMEANGKTVCACGKEVDLNDGFCKHCGAKIEKTSEVKEEAPKAVEATAVEEKTETAPAASKPMTTSEFINTFNEVMVKYGFKK